MRIIKIDPYAETVTETVLTQHTQRAIYIAIRKFIGCAMIQPVRIGRAESLWVDEEGLLKNNQALFAMPIAYPQPLAGRAVITGMDYEGNFTPTHLSLDSIKREVIFRTGLKHTGFKTEEYDANGFHVISRKALFKDVDE